MEVAIIVKLQNLISERRSFNATSLLTANSKYINRILNATILVKVLYLSFECVGGVTLVTTDSLFNVSSTIRLYNVFESVIMENGKPLRIGIHAGQIIIDSTVGTQVTAAGYFNLAIPFEWQ